MRWGYHVVRANYDRIKRIMREKNVIDGDKKNIWKTLNLIREKWINFLQRQRTKKGIVMMNLKGLRINIPGWTLNCDSRVWEFKTVKRTPSQREGERETDRERERERETQTERGRENPTFVFPTFVAFETIEFSSEFRNLEGNNCR